MTESYLKGKAFISFDFFKKIFGFSGEAPQTPLENLNVFTFVPACLSGLVLVIDMANKFYCCGKLSLKLLSFRLILTYFGRL